jgi:hypothetical protein
MAKNYKIIAQSNPAATTDTTLYTVPSATQAVISTITVCNIGSSTATYRIAVRPNGESLANKHYVAYGSSVPGNDTIALTLGLTIDAADVVTVQSSTASVSFGLFGSEIV